MSNTVRTHIDLFSGIGGFSIAAGWAGVQTIGFAETDDYASRVLQRHWPDIRNYGDVRNVPELSAWFVTGGVPCQPASIAGQRKGAKDDRWLWPEAIAAVERIKPTWICLENPLGILSLEQPIMSIDLEGYGNLIEEAIRGEGDFWAAISGEVEFIFRDLISSVQELGYEVSPVVIPACGVGAWHRRYRVWIMGHATSVQPRTRQQSPRANDARSSSPESLPDADGARKLQPQGRVKKQRRRISDTSAATPAQANGRRAHAEPERVTERKPDGRIQHWTAEPDVGRVAHGIPARLDRLRCLGNAIVPQVAFQLIKRMVESEDAVLHSDR